MRKFTLTEKNNGEMVFYNLSALAKRYVEETSPIEIYEYEFYDEATDEYTVRYAWTLDPKSCLMGEDLTFEELNAELEAEAREVFADDED